MQPAVGDVIAITDVMSRAHTQRVAAKGGEYNTSMYKLINKKYRKEIDGYLELLVELDFVAAPPLDAELEAGVEDATAGAGNEADPATCGASLNEPGAKFAFAADLGGILDATHWRYASICSTQRLSLYCKNDRVGKWAKCE